MFLAIIWLSPCHKRVKREGILLKKPKERLGIG